MLCLLPASHSDYKVEHTILSYQLIPEEIGEELPILRSIKTVTTVVYWSDGTSLVGTLNVIIYIVPFDGFNFNQVVKVVRKFMWEKFLVFDNLAIMVTCMGTGAKAGRQSGIVFRAFSIIIWLESTIITINTKLPGGNLSPFSKGVFILIFPWTACSIAFISLKYCLIQMLGIISACVWECSQQQQCSLFHEYILQDRHPFSVYPVTLLISLSGFGSINHFYVLRLIR